ncbi:MAG: type II toxin-antitoxin system MqsA family antitoxin [Candidatus Korobacteraceae bacterium]|jgi:YgiT-type zinc finger domain-containing protein
MKCVLCKNGVTRPSTVTVTLERGNTVVVVRDVPAEVCENCGEYYLDSPVAQEVYSGQKEPLPATRRWKSCVTRRKHIRVAVTPTVIRRSFPGLEPCETRGARPGRPVCTPPWGSA